MEVDGEEASEEGLTPEEAEHRWHVATTFFEMCELMALFIEGKSPFIPGYFGDAVDTETLPIVPYLAALNRAGLMTTQSQPGQFEPGYKQRAFVHGFANREVALKIATLALYSDLHICVFPPDSEEDTGYHVPVTVDNFQPFTWAGMHSLGEIEHYSDVLLDEAILSLEQAWYVTVIDLTWGRNDHLWESLTHVLCYSPYTHPNLELSQEPAFILERDLQR